YFYYFLYLYKKIQFFCEKCVKASIDMENTCWACNNPLDESKPFKPYKKQEEFYGDLTKTDLKLKKYHI
ncbi:MAG: hypothetical protein ACTSPU_14590, partial [Promethearchaeota archaeon]